MQINLKNTKLQDENKRPIVFYHATPYPEKIVSFLPLSHFGTQTASKIRSMHFAYEACGIDEPACPPQKLPDFFQGKKIPPITTYAVNLCIKNPLKIPDLTKHSLQQYYNWFSQSYSPKPKFLTGSERWEGDVVGVPKIGYKKLLSEFIFVNPFTKTQNELKQELACDSLYGISVKDRRSDNRIPSFLFSVRSQVRQENYALAEQVAFQRMIRFLEGEGYDGFFYQNEYEDKGQNSYIIFRPQQVFDSQSKETEHSVLVSDKAFLQKTEMDFFASKGVESPCQRIKKHSHLKYLRCCLKKNHR